MEQTKIQDTAMYQTRDYSQFVILDYNRKIDIKRVEGLMASIKKHGFLMPILVSEDMEVADGQHRLEAAKRLNSGVTYIKYNISSDNLPLLISKLNSLSKNWSYDDYYMMWKSRGKETYLWFGDTIEKYDITFQEMYFILSSGQNKIHEKFKEGILELTQSQKERIIENCERFKKFINYSESFRKFNAVFRRAVLQIIKNPLYNENRMFKKLEIDGGRLLNCVSYIDFLFQLEVVYNRGERDQVDFIKTRTTGISRAAKKKGKKRAA